MRSTLFAKMRGLIGAACLALLPGLAAAQACPDIDLVSPVTVNSDAAALATASVFEVKAGGKIDLASCPDVPGTGFLSGAANIEVTLGGNVTAQRDMQVSVVAACDTTLLVNDASGAWHYSDDEDGGMNPRVVLPVAEDGVVDIWVGAYDATSPCAATVSIATLDQGTALPTVDGGGAGLCPDPSGEGDPLVFTADQLATAQTMPIVAGGDLDLAACSDVPGSGYIVQSPDFELNLTGNTAGQDIEIGVTAACDAVLLINDAQGEWQFVDDTNGTDPVFVVPSAMDGVYDIWVGSLMAEGCDSTLSIRAVPAGQGGLTPPVTDDATAMPDPGNLMGYRDQMGAVLTFQVTGAIDGSVWGTDIYTDDSDLSTAAVHAGVLAVGQSGTVTVQITGPYKGFDATEQNGVATSSFGKWDGSYSFVRG